MATFMYNKGREGFLDGSHDWDTNTYKLLLTTSGYAPASSSVDDNLDDIVAGNRVTGSTSGALASKTVTDGVADAADVTLTAVPAGTAGNAIVIFKDTGVEATSRLVCYIDNYTGLPVTPNGGNITIQWPGDANRIFKL